MVFEMLNTMRHELFFLDIYRVCSGQRLRNPAVHVARNAGAIGRQRHVHCRFVVAGDDNFFAVTGGGDDL